MDKLRLSLTNLANAMYCFSSGHVALPHTIFDYYNVCNGTIECDDMMLEKMATDALVDYHDDIHAISGGKLDDCHGYIGDIFYAPIRKALFGIPKNFDNVKRLVDIFPRGLGDKELVTELNEMQLEHNQYMWAVDHYKSNPF